MPEPRRTDRPGLALAIALLWLSAWEALAPADRRTTWRHQWTADLWHYWRWLSGQPMSRASAALRLLSRAWAACPHALTLRVRQWSLHMLLHDIRFAWRMTVRRPAFTAVAILILGLGIGANATIYSWVETVLLKPIPGVPDQGQLVSLRGTTPSRSDLSFSYLNYQDLRAARPDGLEDLIAFRGLAMNIRGEGEPVRVWGELVTPNFFDVLRVGAVLGRTFVASEAPAPGRDAVAVLSHRGWQRVFASDPGIVGRSVMVNGQPFTIVGVAEPGFQGTLVGVALDVFLPLTMQKAVMSGDRLPLRGNSFLQVFARLQPGATVSQAQASASVIAARLAAAHPVPNEGRGIKVIPLWRDGASGLLLPVMATLLAVVGVVLLIACANLSGLLLARAAGRQREVAVRLAVGASRARLVRQFLIESLLLALCGGAAGVVLSYWTAGMLNAFIPPSPIPIGFRAGVSTGVIAVSIALTLATAVVFGLLPAIRASRPDVATALKDAAASVTGAGRRGLLRQGLVVTQLALSTLLLVCAALFVRSLGHAQVIDPGFSLRQGLIASIDLLASGYDETRGAVFIEQLLQRLSASPQVSAATVASALPLDISAGADMNVQVDGYELRPNEEITTFYNRVGPAYFETMGIPIVKGRAIDARDVEGRELAVVINETMARRYWKGRDAVGSIVRFGSGPARVVGVSKDGKYRTLNEEPRNYMFVPVLQYYRPDLALVVRTTGEPAGALSAMQAEIRRLDASMPLFDVRSVDEHMQFSTFIPRMASTLLGLFGALALLLAVVGLYSVIAQSVIHRTHEIGVRMALGADRREILHLILRQGVGLTAGGLIVGLALAAGAGRLVGGQLMGVTGTDPYSFGVTAAILACVSLLACVIPARRASGLDPLRALRRE
jgi:predicted permease